MTYTILVVTGDATRVSFFTSFQRSTACIKDKDEAEEENSTAKTASRETGFDGVAVKTPIVRQAP
jgi:hypothetical protein